MIHRGLLGAVILAAIAFIMVGVAMQFGPTMIEGFEETRTAGNVSQYMALTDVIEAGPTLIILGFIIMVGVVGFLGVKVASKGS